MKEQVFDFKKALEDLKEGKPLSGKGGILTPLIKKLTEMDTANCKLGAYFISITTRHDFIDNCCAVTEIKKGTMEHNTA